MDRAMANGPSGQMNLTPKGGISVYALIIYLSETNGMRPKSNRAFWNAKFRRNVRRDAEHEKAWAEDGWNLIVIWECGLKTAKEREKTFAFILRNLADWGKKV